jgi:hypothetical protein
MNFDFDYVVPDGQKKDSFIPFMKDVVLGTGIPEIDPDEHMINHTACKLRLSGSFMMDYDKIDIDQIYEDQKKGKYPITVKEDSEHTVKVTGHEVDFDSWSIVVFFEEVLNDE